MSNPGPFLSTLAESAAAIVAIVGGFLVSRLVAISSEREGLRRQLGHAEDQLRQVVLSYEDAHGYRLDNSERTFRDWVLDDLVGVAPDQVDREALFQKHNIPRGSSCEEMEPYLERLIHQVARATVEVSQHVHDGDNRSIDLADLEGRGLVVPEDERKIYGAALSWVAKTVLPTSATTVGGMTFDMPMIMPITSQAIVSTDLRRLDESIREEQALAARKHGLEDQVARLKMEIGLLGRPVGVLPAIVVLTVYSLIGVVLPITVMGFAPSRLSSLAVGLLTGLFTVGLSAVLGYIYWYAHTVSRPPSDGKTEN